MVCRLLFWNHSAEVTPEENVLAIPPRVRHTLMDAAMQQTNMGEIEDNSVRSKVTDAKGILKQNRQFLDYFWDIAKPEREIRLKAIEDLIEHLKQSEKVWSVSSYYFNIGWSLLINILGRSWLL